MNERNQTKASNLNTSYFGENQFDTKFQIFTKLKDFYNSSKLYKFTQNQSQNPQSNYIEEKIEPIYESMRLKFKSLYNNLEPSFFIRIPYTQILFGDSITALFEEKILTTIEKDLIICGNSMTNLNNSSEKFLTIEFFDRYCNRFKYPLVGENSCDDLEMDCYLKFITSAYNSGIQLIKPKNLKSTNLLINYNFLDIQKTEVLITSFIASFFSSFYVEDGFKLFNNDKTIYELCLQELLKLGNYQKFSSQVFFQLFLKKNSIGVFTNNEYKQFKINSNYSLLICDTFSPEPPLFYQLLNCHSKRRVEFKLGLALILRRFKKSLSYEEISEICSDLKSFFRYFEENLETIFELIE